jgi:hypothetical protein
MSQKQNPDLPNYQHASLIEYKKELDLVKDVWGDLRSGFKKYIHKEQKEELPDYEIRLSQTVFNNLFKPAIKSYSGLLSRFKLLEGTPETVFSSIDNVDGKGNSLEVFLADADDNVLRDGATAFIVDFPDTQSLNIISPIDLKRSGLRPFFTLIDRRDLINWDFEIINGVQVLLFAIVREFRSIPDGKYGKKTIEIFREFRRGNEDSEFKCYCVEWEIRQEKNKKEYAVQIGEPHIYSRRDIPIVIYSATDREPLSTIPPFINAAHLNIQMLRKQSQLDETQRRINLPTAVRIGCKEVPDPKSPTGFKYPDATIGRDIQDLPIGGDFKFEEPSGNAIESTREDIKSLRHSIDRVSLAFLSNERSGGAMTATEALLNTAQVTTTINGIARRKESVVQELFALWAEYTGEINKLDLSNIGIAIDDSIIKPPLTDQGIQATYGALNDRVISPELGYLILKDGGAIPEGYTLEKFVKHWTTIDVESKAESSGRVLAVA